MRQFTRQEQAALDAVAKRFSAVCENGANPHSAHLVVAGKRIGVDLRTLHSRGIGSTNPAKPRLRFDKEVFRLIGHLQTAVAKSVPGGMSVLLTVTAPIRLGSKTAAALEDKIRALLGSRPPRRDARATIHGNRTRIRFVRIASARAPKLLGFVHNPGTDPVLLFNMTAELLELLSFPSRTRPRRVGRRTDRWLVLISPRSSSCLGAYRYIYSRLRIAKGHHKVLMVLGDGSVGMLEG